jgi:tetratricopeptide (TPR) repeat protein
MQTDYDNNLQSYFTDMEHLRGMFNEYVAAEKLPKRLIVFHGVGGVGKSSLLRMFRLHCKSEKIPVALASGDDAKSVLDVITRWMEDLKADGVKFSSLNKTLESYRAIQAKVEDQAKKSQSKVMDMAGKAASKTAEAAGGMVIGAAIGSIVPGVGTAIGGMLGSAVGGMGAEALTDWMRGFLDKSSIDLLLDPAKKLTSDFLEDLAKAAEKKRMVLLLDTYEQMSALEDWVGEVAQKIHPNVLMVIAGRKLPDWNRVWSGWMMNAQVEELKPMTEDIMRELIHRYYATMRGGEPDPVQVDAIIKFARGLPMVVTSAVQLWVKYGVEDFQSVKAEIVANLVDRLMEGVPSSLIPALEAAAVVRWFDQPILRAVLNKEDVRDVYNELRRFPFVRSRSEGLALHDSVREMMDENLQVQDSERHSELHERAAVYYEKKLERATVEETERLGLERLYHRVRANEETGIKLFQEMAEELARYRLLGRLRILLNDSSTYPLEEKDSKLWKEFYAARLAQLGSQWEISERIYEAISATPNITPRLRAYTYCSLGAILSRFRRLGRTGQADRVTNILKTSLDLIPLDSYLATSFISLAHVYHYLQNWDNATEYYEKFIQYQKEQKDMYGLLDAYNNIKSFYAHRGEWQKMFDMHKISEELLSNLSENSYLKARYYGWSSWAWAHAGKYSEGENKARKGLGIAEWIEDIESIGDFRRDLALLLIRQSKYFEAEPYLDKSLELYHSLGEYHQPKVAFILLNQGELFLAQTKWEKAEQLLTQSVNILQQFKMDADTLEMLARLGYLYELKNDWTASSKWYDSVLNLRYTGRLNMMCQALTGLIRVKHAQGDLAAIPPLLAEAEQLAQQYEYNDDLASLRLTQGHMAWENGNKDEAIAFYQHAMTYALRYNRFLLDELISGRPQGTPLRPIIPYCLERGEEGKKILSALRDWWKTGVNNVGTPRPDTISPIPEGIPLLEAEKLARECEPGDGSMQKSVVEQLEAVL